MSHESKDEMLANFQAYTGIDDVGEAMLWLEEAGWDMWGAIRNAVPQESQAWPSDFGIVHNHMNSTYGPLESVPMPMSVVPNGTVPVALSDDFMEDATTSESGSVALNIYYMDSIFTIKVPERMKLSDLKTVLYAKTGVPVCAQMLNGWDVDPMPDDDRISTANYPADGKLKLTMALSGMDYQREAPSVYTLQIIDESKCKDYSLTLPGNRTIRQVKNDVFQITDIEPQHQFWVGWPTNITDATTLCEAGLNIPIHTLSVRSCKKDQKTVYIDLMDSDESSPEEFEDASETFTIDEDMFVDEVPQRVETLIPDDIEDEATGAIHFSDAFSRRYGASHPEFFPGALEDAIKEACLKPANERRLLALYLHHDRSVLANVFCTELLCFESVLQTLAAYFVIWGWDITHDSNRNKFLGSVTQSLGVAVADTIRSIHLDNLPALIIITRSKSNTELFNVINGNIGINELLTMLIHAVDVYGDMQKAEMKEEEERNKRELIKSEQDQAFEESLLLDRAKDEAKRQQELLACQERERKEKERIETQEKKEAERLAIKKQLPEEPAEDTNEEIIQVRFRCPGGGSLQRRFLAKQELKVLFNYLHVEGYPSDEFKMMLSWPTRDLTTLNRSSSFKELKLHSQEMVILEER